MVNLENNRCAIFLIRETVHMTQVLDSTKKTHPSTGPMTSSFGQPTNMRAKNPKQLTKVTKTLYPVTNLGPGLTHLMTDPLMTAPTTDTSRLAMPVKRERHRYTAGLQRYILSKHCLNLERSE